MAKKSVDYLVEYAKGQVGRPYWCGTYGMIASQKLLDSKRAAYPSMYPNPGKPAFTSQFGQKVHDCNGLVYAASECDTPNSVPKAYPNPYWAVPTLYKHCEDAGKLTSETKLVKGELLFRNSLGHVGIYGGDGYVYHAKGHAWGVLKEKYNYKEWTHHGKFKEMYDYSDAPAPVPTNKITIDQPPYLTTGLRGSAVKVWQQILVSNGFDVGVYGIDGDFGGDNKNATVEFQKKFNINADGVVGPVTWTTGLNTLTAK